MKIALLLRLDLGYCRHVLSGIRDFVVDRGDWVFRHAYPETQVIDEKENDVGPSSCRALRRRGERVC